MSQPIQHELTFNATPTQVYQALMDPKQHAAFTGGPAEISPDEGGAFSCHGGRIVGRNLELVPDTRIVQAWRPQVWPQGVYSVVRFDLKAEGDTTRLTLTHTGVPEDARAHIDEGWKIRYWEPLTRFLA